MSQGYNMIIREWGAKLPLDRVVEIDGKKIRVAAIAECMRSYHGKTIHFRLMRDCRGVYYAYESDRHEASCTRILDGRSAMKWFVKSWLECPHLAGQFVHALENPSFEFVPLLEQRAKKPRRKNAKAEKLPPFAVQLEMATALVSVAHQLAEAPSVDALCQARRTVAQLHQSLHAEETFRAATA